MVAMNDRKTARKERKADAVTRRTLCLSAAAEAVLRQVEPKNVSALVSLFVVLGSETIDEAVRQVNLCPDLLGLAVVRIVATMNRNPEQAQDALDAAAERYRGRGAMDLACLEQWRRATHRLGLLAAVSRRVEQQAADILGAAFDAKPRPSVRKGRLQ